MTPENSTIDYEKMSADESFHQAKIQAARAEILQEWQKKSGETIAQIFERVAAEKNLDLADRAQLKEQLPWSTLESRPALSEAAAKAVVTVLTEGPDADEEFSHLEEVAQTVAKNYNLSQTEQDWMMGLVIQDLEKTKRER